MSPSLALEHVCLLVLVEGTRCFAHTAEQFFVNPVTDYENHILALVSTYLNIVLSW